MKKNKHRRKGKGIAKILAGIAALALLGWFISMKINLEANAGDYDFVVPFETRDICKFMNAAGNIEMCDSQVITADVSQKIKTINCKTGDIVNTGDVLCEFESGDIDEQIAKLEKLISDTKTVEEMSKKNNSDSIEYAEKSKDLSLQRAELALKSAQKAFDTANSKYGEYYLLYYNSTDDAESKLYYQMYKKYEASLGELSKNIDECQTAYDNAKFSSSQSVEEAKSQIDMQNFRVSDTVEYERMLEKLRNEKNNLVVKAPVSGIISESYAYEGMYAENGELFKIGNMGDYKIKARVKSKDILNVKDGMDVVFTTILTGSTEITGKVTDVSDVFEEDGYSVEIEITDKEAMEKLKPNIAAIVRILTLSKKNVQTVPYDSIIKKEDGSSYVYRVVKDKSGEYITESVDVKVGEASEYYVEVTAPELSEGDLILGGAENYKPGDKIKLKGMTE